MSDSAPPPPSDQARTIEVEMELNAPIEAVWKALTDADELTNWFPPEARITPGKGGSIWVKWGEGMEWETPIDAWEEPTHLRQINMRATPADEADAAREKGAFVPFDVAVDYHLRAKGGTTVLRLVHSGFSNDAAWDNQYDGTVRGWAFELRGLKHYLEHHLGTPRRVIHISRGLVDLSLDDAWNRLMSADGLLAGGNLDGLSAGDRYELRTIAGDDMTGVIQIINPPKDFCATAENLNDAFLRVRIDESCMTAAESEANIFLSTYGLADRVVQSLEASLAGMMESLFGKAPAAT